MAKSLELETKGSRAVTTAISANSSPWLQLLQVLATLSQTDPPKPIEELRKVWSTHTELSAADEIAFAELSSANNRLAAMHISADKIRLAVERRYDVRLPRLPAM